MNNCNKLLNCWLRLSVEMTKQSTKQCPKCGNTNLVELGRYHEKVCVDHNPYVRISWYIDEGQKPLYGNFDITEEKDYEWV